MSIKGHESKSESLKIRLTRNEQDDRTGYDLDEFVTKQILTLSYFLLYNLINWESVGSI